MRKASQPLTRGAKALLSVGVASSAEAQNFDEVEQDLKFIRFATQVGKSQVAATGESSVDSSLPPSAALFHYVQRSRERQRSNCTVLKHVALEDEWQISSCASLPFTIIFFVLFTTFFQIRSDVTNTFLAETSLRTALGPSTTMGVDSPDKIFSWMEQVYFPHMWTLRRSASRNSTELTRTYRQLQGGVMLVTSRNDNSSCDHELVSKMSCFSSQPEPILEDGGAFLPRLGQAIRRLISTPLYYGFARTGQRSDGEPACIPKRHRASVVDSGRFQRGAGKWRRLTADHPPRVRQVEQEMEPKECTHGVPPRDYLDAESPWQLGLVGYTHRLRRLVPHRQEMNSFVPSEVGGSVSRLEIPISWDLNKVLANITYLKDELHVLSPTTRVFAVEALVLSADLGVDLLSECVIEFLFSRGGAIYVRHKIDTIHLTQVYDKPASAILAVLWLFALILVSVLHTWHALKSCKQGGLRTYLTDLWNGLENLTVFCGWAIAGMLCYEAMLSSNVSDGLKHYHGERASIAPEALAEFDRSRFRLLFDDAEPAVWISMYLRVLVANYHIILVFRFFQASRGQARLATVTTTIRRAGTDLIHLLLVFIIIFAAYASSGHILFGRRMPAFATPLGSVAALIEIVFEREFQWADFSDEHMVTAAFWIFSFVVLVVIVMVNIFLAMVLDTYGGVMGKLVNADTLLETARHLATRVHHLSSWVHSSELIEYLDGAGEFITRKDMKFALPDIPSAQLDCLFGRSDMRMYHLLANSSKTGLPEIVSSAILSVEKLNRNIPLFMDVEFKDERNQQNHRDFSSPPGPPAATPNGKANGANGTFPAPVANEPFPWLRSRLIEHLQQQDAMFDHAAGHLTAIETHYGLVVSHPPSLLSINQGAVFGDHATGPTEEHISHFLLDGGKLTASQLCVLHDTILEGISEGKASPCGEGQSATKWARPQISPAEGDRGRTAGEQAPIGKVGERPGTLDIPALAIFPVAITPAAPTDAQVQRSATCCSTRAC